MIFLKTPHELDPNHGGTDGAALDPASIEFSSTNTLKINNNASEDITHMRMCVLGK
jgi:hypothetical protein